MFRELWITIARGLHWLTGGGFPETPMQDRQVSFAKSTTRSAGIFLYGG